MYIFLNFLKRQFFDFLSFCQHCFIRRPSDSTVSEDAGIDPRTGATLASTIGQISSTTRLDPIHSMLDLIHTRLDLINNSARSHPQYARSHPNSVRSHSPLARSHPRLYLIHTGLDLIHSGLDLIHIRLELIHSRLDLIHNLPRAPSAVLLVIYSLYYSTFVVHVQIPTNMLTYVQMSTYRVMSTCIYVSKYNHIETYCFTQLITEWPGYASIDRNTTISRPLTAGPISKTSTYINIEAGGVDRIDHRQDYTVYLEASQDRYVVLEVTCQKMSRHFTAALRIPSSRCQLADFRLICVNKLNRQVQWNNKIPLKKHGLASGDIGIDAQDCIKMPQYLSFVTVIFLDVSEMTPMYVV